jgi:flavin-dependent dehydrogenase
VGLDYADPHLNLYEEFQQWKRHPWITRLLEGGSCLQVRSRGGLRMEAEAVDERLLAGRLARP